MTAQSTGNPQSLPSVPPWLPAVLAALTADQRAISDCVASLRSGPESPSDDQSRRESPSRDTYNYGYTAAEWLGNIQATLVERFPLAQPTGPSDATDPRGAVAQQPITPRVIHRLLREIADRFGSAKSSGDVYRPLWEFAAETATDAGTRPLKSVLRGAELPLRDAVRAADRLSGGPLGRGTAAATAGVQAALRGSRRNAPRREGRHRRI